MFADVRAVVAVALPGDLDALRRRWPSDRRPACKRPQYPAGLCLHCLQRPKQRPRGLCWPCYYEPGVRERYPPTSKFGRRGVPNFYATAPLPEPTTAPPGTPEKLAVLEDRARRKQALWHPLDATSR